MVSARFASLFFAMAALVAVCSAMRGTFPHHDAAKAAMMKRAGQPSARPAYATPTSFNMQDGSSLFAWQSKTPHDQSQTEHVVIILHGVDRNANDYFTVLNNAYVNARKQNLPGAQGNVLRVAPLFFAVDSDASKLNASTLAWGEDNNWAAGAVSQHPSNVQISSLTVFESLVSYYSDASKFPNMKKITFAGHGGGALIIQRYAALRPVSNGESRIKLRYVIANPSTMLYFTKDRPSKVSENDCDIFNLFYYGLEQYDIPFNADTDHPDKLFKTYASRDVRYLVGVKDTSATDGDQSCGARAQGGPRRDNRSLSYWKYINYLAKGAGKQQQQALSGYPGNFSTLESGSSDTSSFRTSTLNHKISKVQAGHVVSQVLGGKAGLNAIFGN